MIRWRIDIGSRFGVDIGVDIHDNQYEGEIKRVDGSGSPIGVTMGTANSDPYRKINASKIDLELWSYEPNEFEDLFRRNTDRWRIFLYKDETLESVFIPITDANSEPVKDVLYTTRITGVNLALLKSGLATDVLTQPLYRRLDAIRLLIAEYFDLPVVDGTVFYPNGTDQGISSLYQQWINPERLEGDSPYQAIEKLVMKGHQVRIARGKVFILPVAETFTGHEYDENGYVSSQAYIANTNGLWIDQSQRKKMIHFRDGVRRTYNTDPVGNIVPNGDFERDDFLRPPLANAGFPKDWEVIQGNGDEITMMQVDAGSSSKAWRIFMKPVTYGNTDVFGATSKNILAGNTLKLNFNARYHRGYDWSGDKTIPVQVRVGDHVLVFPQRSIEQGIRIPSTTERLVWEHVDTLDSDNLFQSAIGIKIAHSEGFTTRTWNSPPIPESGQVSFRIARPLTLRAQAGGGTGPQDTPAIDIAQFSVEVADEDGEIIETMESFAGTEGDVYEYIEAFGDGPTSAHRGAIFSDQNETLTDNWNHLGEHSKPIKQLETQYMHSELNVDRKRISGIVEAHDLITLVDGHRINHMSIDYLRGRSVIDLVEIDDPDFITPVDDSETERSTPGRPRPEPEIPDAQSIALGIITQTLDGTYTSIPVDLYENIRKGYDLWIIRESPKDFFLITPTHNAYPGMGTLQIEEQVIEAPAGSFIVKAPQQGEAEDQESGNQIEEFEEKLEALPDDLGELGETLTQLESDLDELNTITLPGLQNDLDALDVRLVSAEGDLTTLNDTTIPNLQAELDQLELDLAEANPVEIVDTLPTTNNFQGRVVFLTSDNKLYRYTGTEWTEKIQAVDILGEILETQIADDSISTPKLQANSVRANEIASNTITANEIASGTITANEILAGTITAAQIASSTITGDRIAADTIVANNIAVGTITALEIAADTITANEIVTGTITALEIAANTITANEIASNTITANQIAADTITANEIGVGVITALEILADTITANEIATGTITALEINVADLFAQSITLTGSISSPDFELSANGLFVSRAIRNELNEVTAEGPATVHNANYGDRGVLKINNTGGGSDAITVTGLQNGVDGLELTIISTGNGPVILSHQNTSSTTTNRFDIYNGNNLTLQPRRSARLIYDGSINRWRVWSYVT